jgi:hypothetical protein
MADGQRVATGMRLLKESIDALDAAAERMGGKSRQFVVDVLIALYAHDLNGKTPVPADLMPSGTRSKKGTGRQKKGGKK